VFQGVDGVKMSSVPRVGPFGGTVNGPSRLALALGGLVSVFAITTAAPAQAQFFFDYGSYNRPYTVKKPKVKKSKPAEATYDHGGIERGNTTKEVVADRKADGPLVITVSLRRQRVSVWDRNGLMMEAPISSGKLGTPTPTGIFSILQKNRVHFSNLYDSAPMPNMQRITWSGVALHAGALPGYPASHGCIRLPHGFSKRLFEVTQMGTRVIVAYDPVRPESIQHEQLFAAYPDGVPSMHALMPGETRVADASDSPRLGPPREVGSVLGVSTALASETPPGYDAMINLRTQRKAEMEKLAAAVADAQAEKAATVAAAKDVMASLDGRKVAVRDARVEVNRLASALRTAEQASRAANQKLAKFSQGLVRKTGFTPEDVARAAADEDRLETAALDLADAAEAAKVAHANGIAALTKAEAALIEADKARADAVEKVSAANVKLNQAVEADAAAKRREAKRKLPVHVFVSRKTQTLYVRQGYEPILETPVTIEKPDQLIGTHVFTAMAVDPAKVDVTWSVASIPTQTAPVKYSGSKKERMQAAAEAERAAAELRRSQTAQAALARIKVPDDVRLQIEDVMKPGSSLIISDNGLSNETGKFTDFIVPVR
jgi:lipoprotein-anchoring transpeptidase ErfK/SrfK